MNLLLRKIPAYLAVVCFTVVVYASEGFPEAERGDIFLDIGRWHRDALGFGWDRVESDGVVNFRWIKALEADVFFALDTVAETDLWIRAAPLFLPGRRQKIGVYINDRFLTEWVCPEENVYADYHVLISAEMLHEGKNTMTLRMAYHRRMPPDRRELAIAVDKILFRPRAD